ncbi:MAG TPA: hypothetical protein VFN25_09760 [Dokdonella sp.]|uniref:hypothetical protein n=1 Tax=Dokdonella sp. TaxID=2291710 RepID=UPI002D7FD462|nr:hypothetical protein [Dokdonella sp.]HET9033179.1 hypothetical protein [Dokdonella sp.]
MEQAVPDLAAARARAGDLLDPLEAILDRRHQQLAPLLSTHTNARDLLARCANVIRIAYVRLAVRHGSLGEDFHAYHNEGHILDILGSRIDRLIAASGLHALGLVDWCVLNLFAACHDLRQRETSMYEAGVGANERASIEEAFRLLDHCGFSREQHADIYTAIDLTISGSTFDARPPPGGAAFNAAELVQSGGALAAKLEQKLDKHRAGWRDDARIVHAQKLALIAADLDTANVAEPFARFADSAENLCLEREMLCQRDLDANESAQPVLGFLTDGQDRFFFDLHRFNSELGRQSFASTKDENAARLKSLSLGLRARIAMRGRPESGRQVLKAYAETVAGLV